MSSEYRYKQTGTHNELRHSTQFIMWNIFYFKSHLLFNNIYQFNCFFSIEPLISAEYLQIFFYNFHILLHFFKIVLSSQFNLSLPFCFQLFLMTLRTAGGASWSTPDLCTPGVSVFTSPPYRDCACVCDTFRSKRQILFRIPLIQNALSVVFLAIAF